MKPKSLAIVFLETGHLLGENISDLRVRNKDWSEKEVFRIKTTVRLPDDNIVAVGWTLRDGTYDKPHIAHLTGDEEWMVIK